MDIQSCPCCKGEAIYADLLVSDTLMWQVSCTACGLSSELDPDKLHTAKQWNMRQQQARLKMWTTILTTLLPASSVICFLAGVLMGISLSR